MSDTPALEALVAMSEKAREQAYAPWSGFHVGATVLSRRGGVYSGCNVESAAFPLGGCAERHAIAAAVLAEGSGLEVVAVAITARDAAGGAQPVPPCGACRQVIHAWGAGALVGWRDREGSLAWRPIRDLLPEVFELPPG